MNWMFSCKQVGELISRRLDDPLGLFEAMRLRVHLMMCGNCSNIERQMSEVHALSTGLGSGELLGDDEKPEQSQQIGNEHRPSKEDG